MGGNIGLPILAQEPLPDGGVYVLELSSYQLDLTRTLDCDVAVLLNITPDHLDRYDGFPAYAASKKRLFEMQSPGHAAIFSGDDEQTRAIASRHPSASRDRGRSDELPFARDPSARWGDDVRQEDWPALQGPHNLQNAIATSEAAERLGVSNTAIIEGLQSFTGLPHRMQRVATIDGVAYVNDSKATNPESAAPALAAFPRIHWIVGGRAKGDDLEACAPYFGNVAAAYTIGEAGPLFFEVLNGRVPVVENAGTLAAAVAHAAAAARPGDTVLLSPACASFDQFRDYEERGVAFRTLVEKLA
jgi:UDP-N-acetylmuramoylalanine--D-glutamate ligase